MKKVIYLTVLSVLLMLPNFALFAADLTGREIMELVQNRNTGDNVTLNMKMELISNNGDKRIRQIHSFSKEFGEDTYRLIFFESPADVRNTGFLTYDYDQDDKDDDQYMFLPALKKTKRIAGSDKSGSFMGSDMNYSDMTKPDLDDYNYKYLKEANVRGSKCWIVIVEPKNKDVEEESGYSKRAVWVTQDSHLMIRSKSWVSGKKEVKFFEFYDPIKIDNVWFIQKVQVKRKLGEKTLHSTALSYNNIKLNQNLNEDLFTRRRLEKGL